MALDSLATIENPDVELFVFNAENPENGNDISWLNCLICLLVL